ncbi:hypothetical protein TNCV_2754281 [Trichonephila clavipes]|nr:hypothetical protein TNCV_2754281 [Trichonephila clavipes]
MPRQCVKYESSHTLSASFRHSVECRISYSLPVTIKCGMQPKAQRSLRAQAQLSETRTETVETFELDLIRVVEDLDGTVESTDTIAKLKTKIENSSTFESDPDFVKTLIQNCIDERVSRNEREVTLEKQKIELAKLQLAKLEKEVELQRAKNKALSLNPAAKVEDKQFETNIENMIKVLGLYLFLFPPDSPLVSMERKKIYVPLRTAYSQAGRCGMQPKAQRSLRAQAQLSETRTETVETFEPVKVEPKL